MDYIQDESIPFKSNIHENRIETGRLAGQSNSKIARFKNNIQDTKD